MDLLDFSRPALDAARLAFAAAGINAGFSLGDALAAGEPEYDLVFNVGVVEHYPAARQASLLRAMASRSRRYVLALVPNRHCYWNSISRICHAAGHCPPAQESHPVALRELFQAAGLQYAGDQYVGRDWTEATIRALPGIADEVRQALIAAHRSPLIRPEQACSLIAGVGTVGQQAARRPETEPSAAEFANREAVLRRRILELERQAADSADAWKHGVARYRKASEEALHVYRGQRAWKVMLRLRRAYTMLLCQRWAGRWRFLLGHKPVLSQFDLQFPELPEYLPADWAVSEPVAPLPAAEIPAPRKYDVVVLAIIDFDFRFQRPQQIAAQFARNGHRVFWISATRVIPADSPEPYRLVPLRKNIWELHLRAPQIDPYQSPMPQSAARIFVEGILEFYRDWGVSATAILAQLPFWRGVAVGLRAEVAAPSCTIAWTIGTSSKIWALSIVPRSNGWRGSATCWW